MVNISKKVIPVLIHTGEKEFTPPIKRILDAGDFYGYADVRFKLLDYPRLANSLYNMQVNNDEMQRIAYEMGRVIAFFSKYHVQDRDQNLGNWLIGPNLVVVKIDFDLKHTRFIEMAESGSLDFWLCVNGGYYPKELATAEGVRQQIRQHNISPSYGIGHFSAVKNYNGGRLPPDYNEKLYRKAYLEGLSDEFRIPPEVSYAELWVAYLKALEDRKIERA